MQMLLEYEKWQLKNNEKTRTVSFRVPEDIVLEIEKDAKSQLISSNSLVNKILLHYVTWDRYQHRSQMYPIPEANLIHVLDNFNETQHVEAIEFVYDAIRDHALLSKKKFDIHSCLEVLHDYCRITGISVEDDIVKGTRIFTINHGLGLKFSKLVQQFVEKIFWELVKMKLDVKTTQNTVIVIPLSKFE